MKNSFITALIILITVSLIGLMAIQIYWIQNSIALRNAQFRRNVKMALTEVNHLLEQEEKMHRLKKHDFGKLIYHFDSLKSRVPSKNIRIVSNNTKRDTAFFMGESGAYALRFDESVTEGELGKTPADTAFNLMVSEEELAEIKQREALRNFEFDEYQAKEIARLIFDISTLDYGTTFLNRYGIEEIDSMLHHALLEFGGINTEYRYGIFDKQNIPHKIALANEPFADQIVAEGYNVRLLPADYIIPPTYLHVWFPNQDGYLISTMWPLLTSSGLFIIVIILAFAYTIRTILRQKKLSEIKNDFINNMTHELKTPISTISLACEALGDPLMATSPSRTGQYVGMIREENNRLGVLVENVLKSAVLDRGEMEMDIEFIDLHEIINTAIRNIELQASQKGGKIEAMLKAENPIITGDKIHLTNVVFNLLDNAIKYSPEKPTILIKTSNDPASIVLSVTDNGLGIKKDDQKRIFEKLYRVHTGNVHNIKGFGLGLSYVKVVVDKHHGTAKVQSELGKGSTFIIQLPLNYDV